LPARFLTPALRELKEMAALLLDKHRLVFQEVSTYGTPRRLVLLVKGLDPGQKPVLKEVKGPSVKVAFDEQKKSTRAALGFAKSQGVAMEDLVVKQVGPVDYLFAVIREEGRPTREVLSGICPALITELHFPKFMRWGSEELKFARPIRWLLALYGEEIVPFALAGVAAGRETRGHRFLSGKSMVIDNPGDYFVKTLQNHVMVDPVQRRASIMEQVAELASSAGGRVKQDEELLDEVVNLVEYPTAVLGSFDESFLRLPAEVLVTSMQAHQRYFPVFGPDGRLLSRFIAVSNTTDSDIIRQGYEKVLRARLADAAFFLEEDLKTPLEQRVEDLKKITWQENLGTLFDKVERIRALASKLAGMLGVDGESRERALRAAVLAKADLTTSMVYEFSELQGVMGCEYARRQGEEPETAQAIFEHYLPRFSGDSLPATVPGSILSIADKIDTLVGCFAIGIQPTGSQDPYALRRAALGICSLVLERGLVFSLRELIGDAYAGYKDCAGMGKGEQGGSFSGDGGKAKELLPLEGIKKDLEEFFAQRLRGLLAEQGFSYDVCEAVLATGVDDLCGAWQRARALANFRAGEAAAYEDLLVVFQRANNLSKKHTGTDVDVNLFLHSSEKILEQELRQVRENARECLKNRDYRGALAAMARLRKPVDGFFDGVMVMAEDEQVRQNRLGLLKSIIELTRQVGDLNKLS